MFKCEKCNSELEPNAKFCTNCGEQVSENIKTEMKDDKPSSKVKIWLLKAVAFFIAAFIFTIARVIFTAINGGSIDGKLEAGGILLFIGMYILLKGLFLKDSSAKKLGGGVLFAYIILSIIFSYYISSSDFSLENQIIKMNNQAPIKLDDETELTSAKLNGNNVDIQYRLIKYTSYDIPYENRNEFKNNLKSNFCQDEGYKKILNSNKEVNVYIYGKDNNHIISVILSKDICSK